MPFQSSNFPRNTKRSFINIKKAFKNLYMFYFETFRINVNPSSVKKIFGLALLILILLQSKKS